MTIPDVSVVIPAHNAAAFVRETLESVLSLDYPSGALDLVIVDDGSTDSTVSEVRAALRNCPFAWRLIQQAQAGPSRARNIGWRSGLGEWIQFLDADDLLDPCKLRTQIERAQDVGADVAVIYSPWQRMALRDGEWHRADNLHRPHVSADAVLSLLQPGNFLATGSQLHRRRWLEAVDGFDERYRFIEDVDLLLRIAMAGGRFFSADTERPLFLYRQRDGSLSRECRHGFVDGCLRNAYLAERFWRGREVTLTLEQRNVLVSVYSSALPFFIERDRRRYRSLLAHVLQLDPTFRRGGHGLRVLTRIVGHEAAESVAARYRRIRHDRLAWLTKSTSAIMTRRSR